MKLSGMKGIGAMIIAKQGCHYHKSRDVILKVLVLWKNLNILLSKQLCICAQMQSCLVLLCFMFRAAHGGSCILPHINVSCNYY